ncbi:MAG: MATE family efflux transporter [Solobacterium sp.]|nr:MATE family efflux transporter [Solobacterium sp.]
MQNDGVASLMREKKEIALQEKLSIVAKLSMPGILAQISEILMQYIDAAMVGALGASASASIGLVASSTWLIGSLMMAAAAGFSVQTAHAVGAGNYEKCRSLFRQSVISVTLIAAVLSLFCTGISGYLPKWLGADPSIWKDARDYFFIYGSFLIVRQLNILAQNMLQCSGNMKTPSILTSLMCLLDVVYNYFLIFETRQISLFGRLITVPGAGLGVRGAALGTALSYTTVVFLMMYAAAVSSPILSLKNRGSWKLQADDLKRAARIGIPMAGEQSALCLAQIVSTGIVAPLGTIAIAAHSFAVTAESICYMPGYGISAASTTLVGQAIGAGRKDLARSFAWLTTAAGVMIMTIAGIVMYFACPYVFAFLTPDLAVQQLGVHVLRFELLAEPLFAASIVATGALRGAGDTLVPGILNLISIWGVRLPMAWYLSKTMGLTGCWIAMASEISVRGILFLIRLKREKWLDNIR